MFFDIFCLFVTLKFGEMIQFDLRIFFKRVVKNHQLVLFVFVCFCLNSF